MLQKISVISAEARASASAACARNGLERRVAKNTSDAAKFT
jgi:hypothetical protein